MLPKKILLISYGILPLKAGSSFIVEKLAQNFSRDEMVVLGEKAGKPINRDANMPEFFYCHTSISLKGRAKRLFIYIRWLLFPLLLYRMHRIVVKERCKVVLAVFPDELYLFAAWLIAKRKNLAFYPYFHNTYIDNRVGIWKRFAKWLEPRVFSLAKEVFVMSEGMRNYYNKLYKGIIFTPLVHTFNKYLSQYDQQDIEPWKSPLLQTSNFKTKPTQNEKIPTSNIKHLPAKGLRQAGQTSNIKKLVLVGTFNQSNIDATARLLDAMYGNQRYQINIYTAVPKFILNMKGINAKKYVYQGFIDDENLLAELQKYDIMVLTHGFKGTHNAVEYQTIFPTRTIPFLISGKPIFALSLKGSFLNRFLIKYDCAEIVDQPDEEVIVETLDRLADNPQRCRQLVKNAFKAADQFYGPNVAKKLKNIIMG